MKSNFYISDFYCTRCKQRMQLPRQVSRQHEPGHLKNIWCPRCQKEVNFVEVKPFGSYTSEIFNIEYQMNNFDDSGKRKESYRQCLARYYRERENGK